MLQARSSAASKGPLAINNRIRASDHRAPSRARPPATAAAHQAPTVERTADRAGQASPHFQLWLPESADAGPAQPVEADGLGSTRPVLAPDEEEREPYYPEVGMLIGGFALIGELGRGSSARVFLARDRTLGDRQVVLKVCRRVGAEAEALALLSHPNIVPIHSVREMPAHGLRLICMPFVPGRTLCSMLESRGWERPPLSARRPTTRATGLRRDGPHPCPSPSAPIRPTVTGGVGRFRSAFGRIRSSWIASMARRIPHEAEAALKGPHSRPIRFDPLPVSEALDIAIPLADALAHAHRNGVLHRDVKPSNVIVTDSGHPVLIDFHLSTLPSDAAGGDRGDRGALLGGTLTYMAPEHIRAFNPIGGGSPLDVDERSDLYGLGLVLFEMLAGRPAFQEPSLGMPTTQRLTRMAESRRNNPAPSPRAENPLVPSRLDAVVRKCLDPDPDRRYGSAAGFRDELIRIREDRRLRHTEEPCLIELSLVLIKRFGRLCRKPAGLVAGLVLGIAVGSTASGAIASIWR